MNNNIVFQLNEYHNHQFKGYINNYQFTLPMCKTKKGLSINIYHYISIYFAISLYHYITIFGILHSVHFSTALVDRQAEHLGEYFHLTGKLIFSKLLGKFIFSKLTKRQCLTRFHKVTLEWQNATVTDLPHKAPFTFRVRWPLKDIQIHHMSL